jgi:hypothetical protein
MGPYLSIKIDKSEEIANQIKIKMTENESKRKKNYYKLMEMYKLMEHFQFPQCEFIKKTKLILDIGKNIK